MTISAEIIISSIVFIAVFMVWSFVHIYRLHDQLKRINDQFKRMNDHDEGLLNKYHLLKKNYISLANDFEKLKGSVEVMRSEQTSRQDNIYLKSIAESLSTIAAGYTTEESVEEEIDVSANDSDESDPLYNVSKALKNLAETFLKTSKNDHTSDGDTDGDSECVIPEEKRESLKHHMEFWAGLNKIGEFDIPEDEKEDEDHVIPYPKGIKFVAYRWIFPTKEKCQPVYGQWYTVIGTIHEKTKSDGTPNICTEEAMWNGYQFVSIKDERFDKVYAYIKMPNSGDIMETIVGIALEKE